MSATSDHEYCATIRNGKSVWVQCRLTTPPRLSTTSFLLSFWPQSCAFKETTHSAAGKGDATTLESEQRRRLCHSEHIFDKGWRSETRSHTETDRRFSYEFTPLDRQEPFTQKTRYARRSVGVNEFSLPRNDIDLRVQDIIAEAQHGDCCTDRAGQQDRKDCTRFNSARFSRANVCNLRKCATRRSSHMNGTALLPWRWTCLRRMWESS